MIGKNHSQNFEVGKSSHFLCSIKIIKKANWWNYRSQKMWWFCHFEVLRAIGNTSISMNKSIKDENSIYLFRENRSNKPSESTTYEQQHASISKMILIRKQVQSFIRFWIARQHCEILKSYTSFPWLICGVITFLLPNYSFLLFHLSFSIFNISILFLSINFNYIEKLRSRYWSLTYFYCVAQLLKTMRNGVKRRFKFALTDLNVWKISNIVCVRPHDFCICSITNVNTWGCPVYAMSYLLLISSRMYTSHFVTVLRGMHTEYSRIVWCYTVAAYTVTKPTLWNYLLFSCQ